MKKIIEIPLAPFMKGGLIAIALIASSSFALVTNINSGATHSVIQDAVTASDSGDTLLVSTGEYSNLSVHDKNLTIIGGYVPDFSTQISYTATVLNDLSQIGIFSYTTSVVEGLTFTGGTSGIFLFNNSVVTARYCKSKNNISHSTGAGACINDSTLVLEYSDIENNSATNTGGYGKGGGAYVSGGALIISDYSHIKNNSAVENGGGVYLRSTTAILEVKGSSSISANSADEYGGGVYLYYGTLYVHDNGRIGAAAGSPNTAGIDGGGIYARGADSKIIFEDEGRLLNNHAGNKGGGAYLYGSSISFYNNAKIGSDLSGSVNYAVTNGGGIYAYGSSLAFTNSDIYSCRTAGSGGAIYAHDCDVVFQNCNVGKTNDTFTNISGNNDGAIEIIGGSLFISGSDFVNNQAGLSVGAVGIDDTVLTITNSIFRNNKADSGIGALYGGTGSSIADIIDSSFISNSVISSGGAIFWASDSNLTIRSSVINWNEADSGGGIYSPGYGEGQILLTDVEMSYNKARNHGGAIFAKDNNNSVTLTDCNFQFNCANSDNIDPGNGGAIYLSNATIIVEGIVGGGTTGTFPPALFIGNVASNNGLGGAVYVSEFSTAEFYNVAFVSNSAYRGGAMCANSDSKTKFVNSLIIQNKANVSLNSGGGIRLFNATANMDFCTVANNSRSGIELLGTRAALNMINSIVYLHEDVNVTTNIIQTVVYSDIEGGYPGVGNINSLPLFADLPELDYQLKFNSPCKNTATNIGITVDCIGIARPQLGGFDMGCYEYIPEPGIFLIFNFGFLIYVSFRRN